MISLRTPTAYAHMRDGFPLRPAELVGPVDHVHCRIYYPHFYDLRQDQRSFYIYWRQEYERGNQLPADTTYRFLYAYEVAAQTDCAEELEAAWIRLLDAYCRRDGFGRAMATWITDLRIQQGRDAFDWVTEMIPDDLLVLDLAIAAKRPPNARVLLPLYSKRNYAPHVFALMRELGKHSALLSNIDTAAVIEAAHGVTATAIPQTLFANLGHVRTGMARFGPLQRSIHSYKRSSAVTHAIDATVEAMLEMVGGPIVTMVSSPARSAVTREAIVRKAVANFPQADTIDGLLWAATSLWSAESLLLLIIVLWLSDVKPYIEGRVAFSSELRGTFETLAKALGLHSTIGSMRKAFWTLGRGVRAVWKLDPEPTDISQVRTNGTAARFIRSLQRELVGSATRSKALQAILAQLARRTHVPATQIQQLLAETTGTAPNTRI
ncbi:MAG: TerB N-terminal domain-containing protein [Candidatus Eremiobacteraeota bacterium]|nr:TerB N-terminal domain-containing protein [Candidatus Eremiobacteraeota bacterium]